MEIKPLHDLASLLVWKPSAVDYYIKSSLTCRNIFLSKDEKAQVLLCHDLRGGYLEDRWRHGTSKIDGYRFWNWWKIDMFVYFSHHFVTIPPASWIDAAHRHGVKVLGTFITEWEAGRKICSKLLSDENLWQRCADQLVEISSFFKFDGWLLNIENELEPSEVSIMIKFVNYLTQRQKMKAAESTVIWYDSVTYDGKLLWQNELNSHNMCFFEACDGIFLNYAWTKESLKISHDRLRDYDGKTRNVFVGCDVFGSEFCDVEEYKTSKDVNDPGDRKRKDLLDTRQCMEMSKKHEMSFAIFASSWTHEVLGSENFHDNETRFWNKLQDNSRRKITTLPIATSFCQGFGKFYSHKGKKLDTCSWSNTSLQMLQPFPHPIFSNFSEDSFVGGGCLRIPCTGEDFLFKLFDVDVDLSHSVNKFLNIKWVSKCPINIRMIIIITLEKHDDIKGTFTNEYHYLYGRGSRPRSDDGKVVSSLLNEEVELMRMHELPEDDVDGLCLSWIESSHKIEIHGELLKGIHLYMTSDDCELNNTLCNLLLGYFELSTSEESNGSIASTSLMESFYTCEISVQVSNGVLSTTVTSANDDDYLNSFALMFLSEGDSDIVEIKTSGDLNEAFEMMNSGDDYKEGSREIYLRWRAGHDDDGDEFPCGGKSARFHVFIGNMSDDSYPFLCVSPTPVVKLTQTNCEVLHRLSHLLIRIECFMF